MGVVVYKAGGEEALIVEERLNERDVPPEIASAYSRLPATFSMVNAADFPELVLTILRRAREWLAVHPDTFRPERPACSPFSL